MSVKLQILLICIFSAIFIWLITRVRKNKIDVRFILPWMVLDLVLIILTIFPVILVGISNLLGIYSVMNMLFFCGFCLSLLIIFVLTTAVSKMTGEVKRLSQRIAIMEKESQDKENDKKDDKKEQKKIDSMI